MNNHEKVVFLLNSLHNDYDYNLNLLLREFKVKKSKDQVDKDILLNNIELLKLEIEEKL